MKTKILTVLFLFFAIVLSSSLMANANINQAIQNLKTSYTTANIISSKDKHEILLARRSGGRSGGRSFSSRRSSSSRSYGGSRSRSRSYGSRRGSYGGGNTYIYHSGGGYYGGRYHRRSSGSWIGVIIFLLIVGLIIYFIMKSRRNDDSYAGGYAEPSEEFNTIKLQFALYATAEDFEREVKKLAEELNYDDEQDLKVLVNETSMLLVQNQDYIKYAFVKQGKPTRNIDVAERDFDNFINEETAKFSQITFQNRSGKVRSRDLSDENKPSFMEVDEYFIISLVVSYANTKIKLKEDNYSWQEYSEILRDVAAISANNIVAAEIIWSPDAEDDILTEDDIITHYPYMIQL